MGETELAELLLQAADVALGHRSDEGVDHGRDSALELAHARRHVAGQADRQIRRELAGDLAHAPLVRRIAERPEQADGETFGAGGDERLRSPRAPPPRRAATSTSPSTVIRSLTPRMQRFRHQRRRRLGVQEVHGLRLRQAAGAADRAAADDQRVLEAARGDQSDAGAAALDQRIGRHRRAVREAFGLAEQLAGRRCRRTAASLASTSRMPCCGAFGVENALSKRSRPAASISTRSVKVPPVSTPR